MLREENLTRLLIATLKPCASRTPSAWKQSFFIPLSPGLGCATVAPVLCGSEIKCQIFCFGRSWQRDMKGSGRAQKKREEKIEAKHRRGWDRSQGSGEGLCLQPQLQIRAGRGSFPGCISAQSRSRLLLAQKGGGLRAEELHPSPGASPRPRSLSTTPVLRRDPVPGLAVPEPDGAQELPQLSSTDPGVFLWSRALAQARFCLSRYPNPGSGQSSPQLNAQHSPARSSCSLWHFPAAQFLFALNFQPSEAIFLLCILSPSEGTSRLLRPQPSGAAGLLSSSWC